MHLILIVFFVIMQWLSIWAGVAKIKKSDKEGRRKSFRISFCSVGLPALIGLIVSIVFLFIPVIPWWVSLILYVVLDIIFAFVGHKLYNILFPNDNKTVASNYKKNTKKRKKNKKHYKNKKR